MTSRNLRGAVLVRGSVVRRCGAAFIGVGGGGILPGSVYELPNARNAIRTVAGVAGTTYRLRRNIS